MSRERKQVHLFNCDRTYKLDAVEGMLDATKAKLSFDPVVKKHYFSLSQMPEMTTDTIPKLQIGVAFFVVHAHESRLSINEDKAGIGYATIYRALLKATEKVIVVIGGDDSYKNEDEEDRSVISRWAWRKVSSQFSEEFLDGRKSFIFSWNKEHRPIHEAALIHCFDPRKKEQKFKYQPEPKQVQSSESAQTPSQQNPLPKPQAMVPPTRGFEPKGGSDHDEESKPYSPSQPTKESSNISNSAASVNRNVIGTKVKNTTPSGKERGASLPEEMLAKPKDLAILGCNVSEDSMQTVMQVFKGIAPKLNLAEDPLVGNLPVDEVKNYLTGNHLKFKFCVLVVDALTVKDAYESQQKYEELLSTAADEVVAKVIVLVCETRFSSPNKEVIEHIISIVDCFTREKGFTAKLENGKLSVDPGVLVDVMVQASVASRRNPQTDPLGSFTNSSMHLYPPRGNQMRNPSESQPRYGCNESHMQQEQDVTTFPCGSATSFTGYITPNGEPIMLKSQLRNGKISRLPGDLEISFPGFQVPDGITQRLLHDYRDTIQAGVKIVRDSNGKLRCTVEPKSKDSPREEEQIADNETLLLATRVRYGAVSFDKDDLQFIYPNWKIPEFIKTSLAREYGTLPKGELCIISDEKGEIKFKVEFGRGQKFLGGANKVWRRFTK